jgi:NAD(P)-dependent dehydrogenase (short-subunit alcohol dehydrogenase family)
MSGRRPVGVVTGGGGGIGAAVAEELGRRGWFVVTVDPLVSLDGSERLPEPRQTTADRIVAAGGQARASGASVTDGEAVRTLFTELAAEQGGLDAVVNVAGITRPTSFATGSEEDWLGVLDVHLGGYLNVLGAALPLMAGAGRGRVVGVTSGSGWRAADAGAYSCAKRAVAALTWQLGRHAPAGVAVNAMSPIAYTRMVAAALERARPAGGGGASPATGGLSLGSMPAPEDLGPFGAHLVGDGFGWCRGQVLFAGGSEVAVIEEPRLLEVLRTGSTASSAGVLEAAGARVLAAAEAEQSSGGGGNPRLGPVFDEPAGDLPPAAVRSCLVVSDRPEVAAAVTAALEDRGVGCTPVEPAAGFAGAASALDRAAGSRRFDGVLVALAGGKPGPVGWEGVLAEHAGIVEHVHADASWTRAVAERARREGDPVRLVTLTDATTAGGRSRAQASAQLARSGRAGTGDQVTAFAVSIEGADPGAAGAVAAHLLCSPGSAGLAGAELVAGDGWVGLRSHPRPRGSITFGGPTLPGWFDATLRAIVEGP